jgi:hypothetical protein
LVLAAFLGSFNSSSSSTGLGKTAPIQSYAFVQKGFFSFSLARDVLSHKTGLDSSLWTTCIHYGLVSLFFQKTKRQKASLLGSIQKLAIEAICVTGFVLLFRLPFFIDERPG